ncbi:hypothetical protein [Paracoccus saliphilus]|uniref:Recombinase n=1 Tax=Paracoccus saliphilus TaxID=405559 RepID=A0AA45W7P5_9RHOB|nr:hypothetical protein [Paracoccus saliphilus]WCR04784.1 recombinase [Paracoccus saliphilus]SIT11252.1 hypothetical protein SAMN05421772_11953 [Paracoccus saliphilus]
MKNVRLPGEIGDGQDAERARLARELTREMICWFDDDSPKVEPGTWKWLIGRYLADEISPFHEVKSVTQDSYRSRLASWEEAIGQGFIADVDFAELKRWQKAMKDNGRSQHYIKAQFTMLRILVGYGKALNVSGCAAIKDVLSEMRIKGPKPRTVAPTSQQVEAVIQKADDAGDAMFALGVSLQWWLSLRGVDVIGQWLRLGKDDPRDSGIIRGNFRWADGLTWAMIDRDVSEVRKTPSKTEDDLPDELVFNLTPLPQLRSRLLSIPRESRVGPVIVNPNTGLPFDRYRWRDKWCEYRDAAGVPSHIWVRDTRAAAITHARNAGATPM